MLRLVADENLNNNLLRALLRRRPDLNIVRLQDAGMSGTDDPTVLAWAAQAGRILLTHDVTTITRYAYERVESGQRKDLAEKSSQELAAMASELEALVL